MSDQPIPEEAIEAAYDALYMSSLSRNGGETGRAHGWFDDSRRAIEAALPFLVAGWRGRLLEDEAIERATDAAKAMPQFIYGVDERAWYERVAREVARDTIRAALGEGS